MGQSKKWKCTWDEFSLIFSQFLSHWSMVTCYFFWTVRFNWLFEAKWGWTVIINRWALFAWGGQVYKQLHLQVTTTWTLAQNNSINSKLLCWSSGCFGFSLFNRSKKSIFIHINDLTQFFCAFRFCQACQGELKDKSVSYSRWVNSPTELLGFNISFNVSSLKLRRLCSGCDIQSFLWSLLVFLDIHMSVMSQCVLCGVWSLHPWLPALLPLLYSQSECPLTPGGFSQGSSQLENSSTLLLYLSEIVCVHCLLSYWYYSSVCHVTVRIKVHFVFVSVFPQKLLSVSFGMVHSDWSISHCR